MPSNPDKTVIAIPENDVDQIIFTNSYNVTVADGNGTDTTFILPETFPPESLVTGIFSFDNGTSWYETTGINYGAVPGQPADAYLFSYPFNNAQNGKVQFTYTPRGARNGGQQYTVILKVAVSLNPKVTQFDTSISKFSGINAYSSNNKYLKIAKRGSIALGSGYNSTSVAHNLGYVPYVEMYYNDGSNFIYKVSSVVNALQSPQGQPHFYTDEQNLYINANAGSNNEVYYKIYSKG